MENEEGYSLIRRYKVTWKYWYSTRLGKICNIHNERGEAWFYWFMALLIFPFYIYRYRLCFQEK